MNLKMKTALLGSAIGLSAGVVSAQEINFMCHAGPGPCAAYMEVFEKYEAENPGVDIVMNEVPYKTILESLPVQLAGGTGPDISTITDFGGLNQYLIDLSPYVDNAYWEENFGNFLPWYRKGEEQATAINGLHMSMTITGGYINRTLFDQAGVEVPGDDADWDTWAAAAREVAEKTGTTFPMAMDRSGHRIAGPAISYGAQFFAEDGTPILVDPAFEEYVRKFVDWNNDGTMAKEVWGGQGGSTYQDAGQEFNNGELVYYFSGSWQTEIIEANVGDLFDWEVVGSPCGAGGCSGMPGGDGIAGFKHTEHPELVAKIIDFMAQEENYRTYTSGARSIPAHAAVAAKGVEYTGASDLVNSALNAWAAEVAKISPIAFQYQGYPGNRAMFNITVQRVSQAIAGELSVDDALERMKEDLALALEEEGN